MAVPIGYSYYQEYKIGLGESGNRQTFSLYQLRILNKCTLNHNAKQQKNGGNVLYH